MVRQYWHQSQRCILFHPDFCSDISWEQCYFHVWVICTRLITLVYNHVNKEDMQRHACNKNTETCDMMWHYCRSFNWKFAIGYIYYLLLMLLLLVVTMVIGHLLVWVYHWFCWNWGQTGSRYKIGRSVNDKKCNGILPKFEMIWTECYINLKWYE